ncbi:hypothetical protein L596_022656 [Steinernema carpocapsae]|uniref:Transmembrane protein 53 n=1 Tax=Steinernema carpocapsae TaxID=34508 RepID=A0A4U5MMD5_STECR|nr:hypothetical protein L596_022656 [Steinernema carpocapsae]
MSLMSANPLFETNFPVSLADLHVGLTQWTLEVHFSSFARLRSGRPSNSVMLPLPPSPASENSSEAGSVRDGTAIIFGKEFILKPHPDSEAPLVLIFGWAGCRDRYLSKYSKLYDIRCAVLRVTNPVWVLPTPERCNSLAAEIYEKVLLPSSCSHVIFHVFSMNGCNLLSSLWLLLDTVPNGLDIKQKTMGIVYDSSPADVVTWQASYAVTQATYPRSMNAYPNVRFAYRCLLYTLIGTYRMSMMFRFLFDPKTYELTSGYYGLLSAPDLPKKQLFLYSKEDEGRGFQASK